MQDLFVVTVLESKGNLSEPVKELILGEIVFATLEGRPSNAQFEQSAILQEFVTACTALN